MSNQIQDLVKQKLNTELTSSEYHGLKGTFSSSQLKTILEDPEVFYKKYVLFEGEKEEGAHFDIGSYFHTAILEPHKQDEECAVFKGIRRGAAWDKFKEENKGKAIITEAEMEQAERLINAVKNSPVAMNRIKRGRPEVSAFVRVLVYGSVIFHPESKASLSKYGWVKCTDKPPKDSIELVLKVRADLLGDDFILDLKSTSSNAKNEHAMRSSISEYSYDLSAALYLDLFTLADTPKSTFIWTFASKSEKYANSKSYKASFNNILVGRAKWKKAVCDLAYYMSTDWQFEDTLGELEPQMYELEHIKEKAEDLV